MVATTTVKYQKQYRKQHVHTRRRLHNLRRVLRLEDFWCPSQPEDPNDMQDASPCRVRMTQGGVPRCREVHFFCMKSRGRHPCHRPLDWSFSKTRHSTSESGSAGAAHLISSQCVVTLGTQSHLEGNGVWFVASAVPASSDKATCVKPTWQASL